MFKINRWVISSSSSGWAGSSPGLVSRSLASARFCGVPAFPSDPSLVNVSAKNASIGSLVLLVDVGRGGSVAGVGDVEFWTNVGTAVTAGDKFGGETGAIDEEDTGAMEEEETGAIEEEDTGAMEEGDTGAIEEEETGAIEEEETGAIEEEETGAIEEEETGAIDEGETGAKGAEEIADGDNVWGFGELEEAPGAGVGAKVSNGDEAIGADVSNGDEVTDEAAGASEGSAGVVGNGTADSG